MPVQMRLSQGDDRFYSPDRDLAYCTPHLVMRAMRGLDPDNQEDWILDYLAEHKIDNDTLVKGAEVLAKYLNSTMLDPQYKQPFEALTAAGYFALPQPVQTIICAKIGQVMISAFFSCIRDVTRTPENPPMDTAAIAQVAAELQARLTEPRWRRWLRRFFNR
jgi:hypothetical protein